MATYVMSDLHGHYTEFLQMLNKISMSSTDNLWILGDIIDRGPGSVELLQFAIDAKKYGNIHFLMGNHEQMMYDSLISATQFGYYSTEWTRGEGRTTITDLHDAGLDGEWIEHELLPWMESLQYYKHIKVQGKDFMLVHAGFDPTCYDKKDNDDPAERTHTNQNRLKILERLGARSDNSFYEVGHGYGTQLAEDMLWIRDKWMLDQNDAPMTTIHGHTTTIKFNDNLEILEKAIGGDCFMPEGGIFHYRNKIDIDCGTGFGYSLGCLRLDDMQEFYVEGDNS